jgi:hypothetical protein
MLTPDATLNGEWLDPTTSDYKQQIENREQVRRSTNLWRKMMYNLRENTQQTFQVGSRFPMVTDSVSY